MKRLFNFMIAALAVVLTMSAQEQKKANLLVDYFYTPKTVKQAHAALIRNIVIDELNKSNRVRIIDVESTPTLSLEEGRREVGVSAGDDMERLAIMTQEGADVLLQGVVNDISFKETTTTNSKGEKTTSVAATVNVTLKVIDPKTGTVAETSTFTYPSGMLDTDALLVVAYSDDEAVTTYSQKMLPKRLKKFINEAFPVVGKVLEIADSKNGKEAKTLYIDLGDNFGAKARQKFDVREIRMVGGKQSRKIIGEVEITDVEGDELSLCKVNKGGREIQTSMDADNQLIVTSKN